MPTRGIQRAIPPCRSSASRRAGLDFPCLCRSVSTTVVNTTNGPVESWRRPRRWCPPRNGSRPTRCAFIILAKDGGLPNSRPTAAWATRRPAFGSTSVISPWAGVGTDERATSSIDSERRNREIVPGMVGARHFSRLGSPTGAMHLLGRLLWKNPKGATLKAEAGKRLHLTSS